MKLQWKSREIDCLSPIMQTVQQRELTQELKLPEEMPDIGRVLGAWGQGIVRSKQWESDSVGCSGGVMVWVLYVPEEGTAPKVLDGWVPFQMRWELPETAAEGVLSIGCGLRFADARSVSPRKIMLRLGVELAMEAFSPVTASIYQPEGEMPGVELLKNTYPMMLLREAGEKTFLLEEDVTIPEGSIQPETLLYHRLSPRITDKKVLSQKVVFRGLGNLHVLGMGEDGQLQSWDFEVPFSQFSQLEGEYSVDAQVEICLCLTSCEVERAGEGQLHLKCSLVAQYRIADRVSVELVEDAYSPRREMGITWQDLTLPVLLERKQELLPLRGSLSTPMEQVADVCVLADPVELEKGETGAEAVFSGNIQLLGYGADGSLQSGTGQWKHRETLPCHENTRLFAGLPQAMNIATQASPGGVTVTGEVPVAWTASAVEELPQVAGLELGEEKAPKPNAPSLILRRAGEERLWDIAKNTGSTVAAILQASGLEGEPAPNQMLLIPVK